MFQVSGYPLSYLKKCCRSKKAQRQHKTLEKSHSHKLLLRSQDHGSSSLQTMSSTLLASSLPSLPLLAKEGSSNTQVTQQHKKGTARTQEILFLSQGRRRRKEQLGKDASTFTLFRMRTELGLKKEWKENRFPGISSCQFLQLPEHQFPSVLCKRPQRFALKGFYPDAQI